MQVTRRDLVKFGGAACLVAGATVGAGAAMADEAGYLVGSSDIAFSEETDILIIGTGIAGLAAGMEPALAGKKIIFAEKKGSFGGDSATSCWFMFATGIENSAPTVAGGRRRDQLDECGFYRRWREDGLPMLANAIAAARGAGAAILFPANVYVFSKASPERARGRCAG